MAAAFVLFFANGTNIVANWVKKRHKIKEDSGNIFKIANIGKHWQKEAQLRNRIKWNKFYIVLKWQRLAKCGTSKLRQKMAQILHCHLMAITGIKSLLKIESQDTVWQKAVKCSTSKWQGMVHVQAFIIGLSLLRASD